MIDKNVCFRLRCDFQKLINQEMLPFDVAQRSQHFLIYSFMKIIMLVRELHIFVYS